MWAGGSQRPLLNWWLATPSEWMWTLLALNTMQVTLWGTESYPGMRGFQQAMRCECHYQVERQAFGCRQGKSPSRRKIRSPVHTTGWFASMQRKQRANKISSAPCPICERPPGTELESRRLFLSIPGELLVKHEGGEGNFNNLFRLSKRGWWTIFQMLAIIFK